MSTFSKEMTNDLSKLDMDDIEKVVKEVYHKEESLPDTGVDFVKH